MSEVRMPEKEELPSNSFSKPKQTPKKKPAAKAERKQIIKKPTKRKRSFLENELTDAKSYMIDDIVIPRFRDMVMEIVEGIFGMAQDAIESAIFGTSSRSRWNERGRYTGRSRGSHTPYNSLYDYGRGRSMRKRGLDYDEEDFITDYRDVIVGSLRERNDIEEEMYNILEDQGYVSVGDVNYILGITTGSYTDEDYGWKTLNSLRWKTVRGGGYILELPKPRAL